VIDGITPLHLVLVLIIALVVVGPGKLPDLGRSLGHAIREFRDGVSAVREPLDDVRQPFAATPPPTSRSPVTVAPATADPVLPLPVPPGPPDSEGPVAS
jgi:sec-independent protein translocase protein TatA